jgi:hypothetical protein
MNNILFAKANNFKPIDKELATKELLKINQAAWFWDEFRGTNMLPLMTRNSQAGSFGTSNGREGEFKWLFYTPKVIRDWFEEEVFPWMGCKTRIMALMTNPGIANKEHIDCDKHEMGSQQDKFRVVLQGRTGTLYFKTKEGDVYAPDVDGPFIMDGSWPHGMLNDSSELKLTIAAGAPWTGNQSYDNIELMMSKNDYSLPDELSMYFKT